MSILLVHGAWHGAWCWDRVVDTLGDTDVRTVDLPSDHEDGAGFTDDVRVVREVLDTMGDVEGGRRSPWSRRRQRGA